MRDWKCEFCEKMRLWNCEFCEKMRLWKCELMWIFWKMRDWKCEFCEKMRLWKCEFCEKWDFQIVNSVKNEAFPLGKMSFYWKKERTFNVNVAEK